jgi:hypothetical protein
MFTYELQRLKGRKICGYALQNDNQHILYTKEAPPHILIGRKEVRTAIQPFYTYMISANYYINSIIRYPVSDIAISIPFHETGMNHHQLYLQPTPNVHGKISTCIFLFNTLFPYSYVDLTLIRPSPRQRRDKTHLRLIE